VACQFVREVEIQLGAGALHGYFMLRSNGPVEISVGSAGRGRQREPPSAAAIEDALAIPAQ